MRRFKMAIIGLLLLNAGCPWRPYVMDRTFRQVTGQKIRLHRVLPVSDDLSRYRILEVQPLENMMLDQITPDLRYYLENKIFEALSDAKRFDQVVRAEPAGSPEEPPEEPTLVLEGAIDDYHPGYVGLRIFELGYNHISLTIRFQLRDKQTGDVLGSASVTVHENRPNGTPRGAANRVAKEIRKYLRSGG